MTLDFWQFILTLNFLRFILMLYFDVLFWDFILMLYWTLYFDALFWRFILMLYFDALLWCFVLTLCFDALFWCLILMLNYLRFWLFWFSITDEWMDSRTNNANSRVASRLKRKYSIFNFLHLKGTKAISSVTIFKPNFLPM